VNFFIKDGTVEDVIRNLYLIRDLIPAKKNLDEEEVRNRLKKKHGVKLAYINGEEIGLTVWHELDEETGYLWLGAYKIIGKGIGSIVLESIIDEMRKNDYKRITVKTGMNTIAANRHLTKYGFKTVKNENGTLYWEKSL